MGRGGHAQSEPGPGQGPGNAHVRRPAYVDAAAGALAGVVARFVVQPLDVLKIRFQVQVEPIRRGGAAAAAQSKYTGLRQALASIVREEGIRVLPGACCWPLLVPCLYCVVVLRASCAAVVSTWECLAQGLWAGTLSNSCLLRLDGSVWCCSVSLSLVQRVNQDAWQHGLVI